MNTIALKIIGIAATAVGVGATLVTNWVDHKQLDAKIQAKVLEILANQK